MAITTLTTEAIEEGFYPITVTFLDEDGEAVIPNAATIFWTLTDDSGNVINDRDYEAEESAASISIGLEGDDLAFQADEIGKLVRRRVIIQWEYDSDLGIDKPAKSEVIFLLRRLTRIPEEVTTTSE